MSKLSDDNLYTLDYFNSCPKTSPSSPPFDATTNKYQTKQEGDNDPSIKQEGGGGVANWESLMTEEEGYEVAWRDDEDNNNNNENSSDSSAATSSNHHHSNNRNHNNNTDTGGNNDDEDADEDEDGVIITTAKNTLLNINNNKEKEDKLRNNSHHDDKSKTHKTNNSGVETLEEDDENVNGTYNKNTEDVKRPKKTSRSLGVSKKVVAGNTPKKLKKTHK